MQLVETVLRAATAFDDHGRLAEIPDQVVEFGRDIAGIEIDEHRLHLAHVGGLGLAALGHRSRYHIEGSTFPRRPTCKGDRLLQQAGIGFDPRVMRATVDPLALVDEAPQRHPAVAIAENDVEKDGDLLTIRLDIERIDVRRRIVEVAPGIKGNDVVIAHAGRPSNAGPRGTSGIRESRAWSRSGAAVRPRPSPAGSERRDHSSVGQDRHRRPQARGAVRPCPC